MRIILLFAILLLPLSARNNYYYDKSEDYKLYCYKISLWENLYLSIVEVESRGDNMAISHKGAIGHIQILPKGKGGYLDEANRISGYDKYSNTDLYSSVKSREIWDIVMNHHNPERDINKAIRMHNPRAGTWYRQRILKQLSKYDKNKDS